MLGESHALLEDFAEYKEDIFLLLETDKHFHDLSDLYHNWINVPAIWKNAASQWKIRRLIPLKPNAHILKMSYSA